MQPGLSIVCPEHPHVFGDRRHENVLPGIIMNVLPGNLHVLPVNLMNVFPGNMRNVIFVDQPEKSSVARTN